MKQAIFKKTTWGYKISLGYINNGEFLKTGSNEATKNNFEIAKKDYKKQGYIIIIK